MIFVFFSPKIPGSEPVMMQVEFADRIRNGDLKVFFGSKKFYQKFKNC